MNKKILVPIDIGETNAGAAALDMAKSVSRDQQGELILLNVLEPLPGYVTAQLPQEVLDTSRADAERRLEAIARENGVPEARRILREGRAPQEILREAEELDADLIVIASHDPRMSDYLLGSVAARVVRHAHCSVLVVRSRKS